MSSQILRLSNFKTASRCWIPIKSSQNQINSQIRSLSSNQRYINLNYHSLSEINLIANDDLSHYQEFQSQRNIKEDGDLNFEPVVFSNEEIHTAGPTKKPN